MRRRHRRHVRPRAELAACARDDTCTQPCVVVQFGTRVADGPERCAVVRVEPPGVRQRGHQHCAAPLEQDLGRHPGWAEASDDGVCERRHYLSGELAEGDLVMVPR